MATTVGQPRRMRRATLPKEEYLTNGCAAATRLRCNLDTLMMLRLHPATQARLTAGVRAIYLSPPHPYVYVALCPERVSSAKLRVRAAPRYSPVGDALNMTQPP